MPDLDLLIRGGTVVSEHGRARLDVGVADGRVAFLGPGDRATEATELVDADGLFVLPGFVEAHAHFMDPGDASREDFPSGSAACAANGVTTVLEHTHGHPVRTAEELRAKREHLEGRSHVDFGLMAHAWPDLVHEAAGTWAAGAIAFKLFTCTTHGVPGHDNAALHAQFSAYARLRAQCLVHCEDESLTAAAEARLQEAGREDPRILVEWRGRTAEEVAVAGATLLRPRGGGLARRSPTAARPPSSSSWRRERARGATLGAEACPQYFLLREHDVDEHGALRKFTPPVRARVDADEEDMWRLLRAGELTYLSSDHAPSTPEQKHEGSLWQCHFGLPGVDTTVPLLLDAAARGRLSYEDVVRVHATAPARQWGLWPRKGRPRAGHRRRRVPRRSAGRTPAERRRGPLEGRVDAVRGPRRDRDGGRHLAGGSPDLRRRRGRSRVRADASCPGPAPAPPRAELPGHPVTVACGRPTSTQTTTRDPMSDMTIDQPTGRGWRPAVRAVRLAPLAGASLAELPVPTRARRDPAGRRHGERGVPGRVAHGSRGTWRAGSRSGDASPIENRDRAAAAEGAGHIATARDAWLRATDYYRSAEFFLDSDDPRRLETFGLCEESFANAGKYFPRAGRDGRDPLRAGHVPARSRPFAPRTAGGRAANRS